MRTYGRKGRSGERSCGRLQAKEEYATDANGTAWGAQHRGFASPVIVGVATPRIVNMCAMCDLRLLLTAVVDEPRTNPGHHEHETATPSVTRKKKKAPPPLPAARRALRAWRFQSACLALPKRQKLFEQFRRVYTAVVSLMSYEGDGSEKGSFVLTGVIIHAPLR